MNEDEEQHMIRAITTFSLVDVDAKIFKVFDFFFKTSISAAVVLSW